MKSEKLRKIESASKKLETCLQKTDALGRDCNRRMDAFYRGMEEVKAILAGLTNECLEEEAAKQLKSVTKKKYPKLG